MDASSTAAFAGPGMDTRQWCSYATVDPGEGSVIFVDDKGNPSPIGPIVVCTLQPSGITVPCRVSSMCAGNQEGEWFPFMGGDEVLVAIPEGDERAGCTIIGRYNQSIDVFPLKVAGMDVTKNNFAFKRLRTPYVIETSASFTIRSALTGAGLTIDPTGNCYFMSGDGHRIALNGSFLKMEAKGGVDFLQIDPTAHEVLLSAGETTQFLLGKSKSSFFSTGTLNIGTAGFSGQGHAITAEQVLVLLQAVIIGLGAAGVAGLPTLSTPATAAVLLNAAIAAATILPILPMQPALITALKAPPDPLGENPGIGRAGLLL